MFLFACHIHICLRCNPVIWHHFLCDSGFFSPQTLLQAYLLIQTFTNFFGSFESVHTQSRDMNCILCSHSKVLVDSEVLIFIDSG